MCVGQLFTCERIEWFDWWRSESWGMKEEGRQGGKYSETEL
jgi:hypothetical protein